MKWSNIKAVLIDLDGTLIDSNLLERNAIGKGWKADTRASMDVERYVLANLNSNMLKPGAKELIATLTLKNIPFAIVTNSKRNNVEKKLNVCKFPYIKNIVCYEDAPNGKPAPDLYNKACSLLRIQPKYCIGIEDSNFGIEALHNANIRSVYIEDLEELDIANQNTVWKTCNSLLEVAQSL